MTIKHTSANPMAIRTTGLVKEFGSFTVLDNLDLEDSTGAVHRVDPTLPVIKPHQDGRHDRYWAQHHTHGRQYKLPDDVALHASSPHRLLPGRMATGDLRLPGALPSKFGSSRPGVVECEC